MTDDAFSALAELIRSRASPTEDAARLVLVGGMRPADAARSVEVAPNALGNALRRYRRALALAITAAGGV